MKCSRTLTAIPMEVIKATNESSITVSMTAEEALAFRAYREHNHNIDIMVKSGVFDLRRCAAEVHFDNEGKIGAINAVNFPIYKRDTHIVLSTG